MKKIQLFIFLFSAFNAAAQNQNAIALADSPFVVIRYQEFSKTNREAGGVKFVNTETGAINKIAFDTEDNIREIQQVNIDDHKLNMVIILVQKVALKKSDVRYNSEFRFYSPDGNLLKTIPFNEKAVTDFVVNEKTGRLVVVFDAFMSKSDQSSTTEAVIDLTNFRIL